MEKMYLMKSHELSELEKEGIEYYFYDAESILYNDCVSYPVEVYFDNPQDEEKGLKLLNRH